MEPEGSLLHSQMPTICPRPEPDQSSSCPHLTSRIPILILSFHLCLGLPSGIFPSGFPLKPCMQLSSPPYVLHSLIHLILLDLITRIIFSEEYRSFSSSLCTFLHSRVTSSHFGPNILLSTLFSNTFNVHSSLNVSDQFSNRRKQQAKL